MTPPSTWVPSKRHFCGVCKVYVPDNPNSKRHHESSGSHKRNMDLTVKKAIKKQRDDAKEETRVKHELKRVEAEAAKAEEHDKKLFGPRTPHPLAAPQVPTSSPLSGSYDRWIPQRNVHGAVFYKNEKTGEMRTDGPNERDTESPVLPLRNGSSVKPNVRISNTGRSRDDKESVDSAEPGNFSASLIQTESFSVESRAKQLSQTQGSRPAISFSLKKPPMN